MLSVGWSFVIIFIPTCIFLSCLAVFKEFREEVGVLLGDLVEWLVDDGLPILAFFGCCALFAAFIWAIISLGAHIF